MIKLTITDENSEELTTVVPSEEDVVFISIGSSFSTDETIVYAFESTVELFRLKGVVTVEDCLDAAKDYYTFDKTEE